MKWSASSLVVVVVVVVALVAVDAVRADHEALEKSNNVDDCASHHTCGDCTKSWKCVWCEDAHPPTPPTPARHRRDDEAPSRQRSSRSFFRFLRLHAAEDDEERDERDHWHAQHAARAREIEEAALLGNGTKPTPRHHSCISGKLYVPASKCHDFQWKQCTVSGKWLFFGLVIAVGVLLLLFMLCCYCCCCRRKKKSQYELDENDDDREPLVSTKHSATDEWRQRMREKYGVGGGVNTG